MAKKKRLVLSNLATPALDVVRDYYYALPAPGETRLDLFEVAYNVDELLHEGDKSIVFFVDAHKTRAKYWAYMGDVDDGYCALPLYTSKPCWWDRHPFHSQPIGAPVEYYPHETRGAKKTARERALRQANLPADTNDFFGTVGVFCSFPCALAYIQDRAGDVRFAESATLLALLYVKLTGEPPAVIPPAGRWETIAPYGHLPIDQFRQTFGRLEYIETPNIRRPYMSACAALIEERPLARTVKGRALPRVD